MKSELVKHRFETDMSLEYMIDAIEDIKSKVPSEYLSSVRVEFENVEYYGDTSVEINVEYTRPSTKEEERADKEAKSKRMAKYKENLRKQLEALGG